MTNRLLNAAAGQALDALSEHRLLPVWVMRTRQRHRIRFLRSLGFAGGVGAEIGVQKGFFSHTMLHVLQPKQLHLIDPWYLLCESWEWATGNKSTRKALANVKHWFTHEIETGRVVVHVGLDEDVLTQLPDHFFDWVYLDTSHAYDHTRRELALLDKKVKPTGTILGDDWFPDPSHRFHGQYLEIEEFRKARNYEVLYANELDHQWAIRSRAGMTPGVS